MAEDGVYYLRSAAAGPHLQHSWMISWISIQVMFYSLEYGKFLNI